jgi:hypothetical protein
MPYEDPDPADPMIRVNVAVPADEESIREMAYTFAEELARTGSGIEEIVSVFARPFYVGAHLAWRRLGEAEVRRIASECAGPLRERRRPTAGS